MTRAIKNRRLTTLMLSAAGVLIWSIIAYQLLTGTDSLYPHDRLPGVERLAGMVAVSSDLKPLSNQRIAALRDPFSPRRILSSNKGSGRGSRKSGPAVERPSLRLVALLLDKDRRLALLQNNDSTTFICKKGDEIEGARLIRINGQLVELQFKEQVFAYRLDLAGG